MSTSEKNFNRYVMVAVDGSPESLEALRQGHRMAQLMDNPIVAVNTWHIDHGLFPPATWNPQKDSEQLLINSIREAFHPATPPAIETATVQGMPAETLLRLSKDADLLVIGSRGHSGMAGVMLGSVSAACAAHSRCPVMVVHGPRQAESAKEEERAPKGTADPDHLMVTF